MKTSPPHSLLLLALWSTAVLVQAFASASKKAWLAPPKSSLLKHQHLQQKNHIHQTTKVHLNLFCSHNAAASTTKSVVAAAVTNLIPRGGGIADKVSTWATTPNGSFNLALGVLAASTAILKIYNRVDSEKDEGVVVVRKFSKDTER